MLKRSIAAMLLIVMVLGCSLANAETEETEQPYLVQITEDDPSIGYVLVQLQNSAGLLPLPQEGEYTKTIRQKMTDGSEMVNVLHITPTGFWMEESNCEGQDCIGEGEVTLENRLERIQAQAIRLAESLLSKTRLSDALRSAVRLLSAASWNMATVCRTLVSTCFLPQAMTLWHLLLWLRAAATSCSSPQEEEHLSAPSYQP